MDKDEQKLDEYLAKASEPKEKPEQVEQTDEELVEQKARESGKPTSKSILQKRTQLSETQLDKEIDAFLNKNAGKINEEEFRNNVATRLTEKGYISKADLAAIQDRHLADYEKDQEKESIPVVSPPPLVANSLGVAGAQAGRLADWASSLKTPGGIGLLIGILFFFIWIIVPVSGGQTRMQLLWGVLTSQVDFRSDITNEAEQAISVAIQNNQNGNGNSGSGSGGITVPDFGNGDWDVYMG